MVTRTTTIEPKKQKIEKTKNSVKKVSKKSIPVKESVLETSPKKTKKVTTAKTKKIVAPTKDISDIHGVNGLQELIS